MKAKQRSVENRKGLFTRKKIFILILVFLFLAASPFLISEYVVKTTEGHLRSMEEASELQDVDCILVLGAGLKSDGTPNHMLQDRLEVGIALYFAGAAPKLLLSGDHGQIKYDEVNAMKTYALEKGVPAEDIFLDHAGFSTYESMYRARDIFEAQRVLVVTQKYHQHRALYIARGLGLTAFGVCSDQRRYYGQTGREVREFAARNKDFFSVLLKPSPTYLGEAIPISGNGLASHD